MLLYVSASWSVEGDPVIAGIILGIGLVVYIGLGILFGKIVQNKIYKKGYKENWFWLGFFFQFWAFLAACIKSENPAIYYQQMNMQYQNGMNYNQQPNMQYQNGMNYNQQPNMQYQNGMNYNQQPNMQYQNGMNYNPQQNMPYNGNQPR